MEQIIVTRPDGTTYPLISRQTVTNITSARQSITLLNEDVVDISIESATAIEYGIGDYITVYGKRYTINQQPKARKEGVRQYNYDIRFEGVQYELTKALYNLTITIDDKTTETAQRTSLTANLKRFVELIVTNANRLMPNRWRVGQVIDTEDKSLTFSASDNCLSVLQRLCSEFQCEFSISEGEYSSINLVKKKGTTLPYTFSYGYGKGLYKLDRSNVDDKNIVTRLWAFGSKENLPAYYRADMLCIESKDLSNSYIEDPDKVAKYGLNEEIQIFDDVKPTYTGTLTKVISDKEFVDESMFDLNKEDALGKKSYIVDGQTPKIAFKTGNLAGYEFDISSYDTNSHTFKINSIKQKIKEGNKKDDNGELPNADFKPAVGDKYTILNIVMGHAYIRDAQDRLLAKAEDYYNQNSRPRVQYNLAISEQWIKKIEGTDRVPLLEVGDRLHVVDQELGVDAPIRVKSISRDILNPYKYDVTLSEIKKKSIYDKVLADIDQRHKDDIERINAFINNNNDLINSVQRRVISDEDFKGLCKGEDGKDAAHFVQYLFKGDIRLVRTKDENKNYLLRSYRVDPLKVSFNDKLTIVAKMSFAPNTEQSTLIFAFNGLIWKRVTKAINDDNVFVLQSVIDNYDWKNKLEEDDLKLQICQGENQSIDARGSHVDVEWVALYKNVEAGVPLPRVYVPSRSDLKGEDGTNVDLSDVLNGLRGDSGLHSSLSDILKSDSAFVEATKGPKGDKGQPGLRGATGPQGAKGDSVELSDVLSGLRSDTTFQGSLRDSLKQDSAFVEATKGPKGDAGLRGATGPQGVKGDSVELSDVLSGLRSDTTFQGSLRESLKADTVFREAVKGDKGEDARIVNVVDFAADSQLVLDAKDYPTVYNYRLAGSEKSIVHLPRASSVALGSELNVELPEVGYCPAGSIGGMHGDIYCEDKLFDGGGHIIQPLHGALHRLEGISVCSGVFRFRTFTSLGKPAWQLTNSNEFMAEWVRSSLSSDILSLRGDSERADADLRRSIEQAMESAERVPRWLLSTGNYNSGYFDLDPNAHTYYVRKTGNGDSFPYFRIYKNKSQLWKGYRVRFIVLYDIKMKFMKSGVSTEIAGFPVSAQGTTDVDFEGGYVYDACLSWYNSNFTQASWIITRTKL